MVRPQTLKKSKINKNDMKTLSGVYKKIRLFFILYHLLCQRQISSTDLIYGISFVKLTDLFFYIRHTARGDNKAMIHFGKTNNPLSLCYQQHIYFIKYWTVNMGRQHNNVYSFCYNSSLCHLFRSLNHDLMRQGEMRNVFLSVI